MRESIAAARIGKPQPNPDGTAVFEFRFSADNPVFAGHFPGHPILPGVFQLELVRVAAGLAMQCALAVREIRKAKFQRPILPGEAVRLALKLSVKKETIQASAHFSVIGQPAGEMILLLCRNQ
jgi:3-hydroxymyristoyl/3-hydroxydecanoyl-(acyl carrier protein) dehydratase